MKIKLLLVDDHTVVRMGLRMLLESKSEFEIMGEAGTARDALNLIPELKPDVVLLDIGLPDISGIEAAREIRERFPAVAVVALTIHEDKQYFFKMLEAGARGYVPKRAAPEDLLNAIRAAADRQVYLYPSLAKLLVKDFLEDKGEDDDESQLAKLTPRENEVFVHLAEGLRNEDIADILVISPKTVARHRENIMRKLNLHSRVELVKYAIRKNIIKP